jgi:hypothetical protein
MVVWYIAAMSVGYGRTSAEEWRLFIDSSLVSLKAVLIHNGNKYPSIPLAHAVHMKDS